MAVSIQEVKKKRFCVMVRFTEAEIATLDMMVEKEKLADRSAYLRETGLARCAGAIPSLPEGADEKTTKLADVLGVWKALGPEFHAVAGEGMTARPLRPMATPKKAKEGAISGVRKPSKRKFDAKGNPKIGKKAKPTKTADTEAAVAE